MSDEKFQSLITLVVIGPILFYMLKNLIRDIKAMIKAPKGRKIEAYYTSAKGYNPFTGEPRRRLK